MFFTLLACLNYCHNTTTHDFACCSVILACYRMRHGKTLFTEPRNQISPRSRIYHRLIASRMEELKAELRGE